MGIVNIHLLFPEPAVNQATQAQAALQQLLVDAHRNGDHPYGSMRRECPLCQLGR